MRGSRLVVILLTLILGLESESVPAERLILLRDDPPAGERLVAELREVGRIRIDVPHREDGERGTSLEEYPFLASVTLYVESDPESGGSRELLGHMAFTADVPTRRWDALLEEAREVLGGLGPEALDQPLAFGRPDALAPLRFGTLQEIVTPKRTVTCARKAGQSAVAFFYLKEERTLPDGRKGSSTTLSSFPEGDEVDSLCSQMFDGASQTLPETFRSRVRVSSRRTLRVTLESRGEIPESATRRELLPRPDALEEHRHPDAAGGKGYRSMKTLPEGAGMEARMGLRDGSELFSSAGRATLEPAALDYPALMLRWRVSHEDQPLGLMPGPAVASSETVVSVVHPLATPLVLEEKSRIDFVPDQSESFSYHPDMDALVERIGELLLRSEDVDSPAVIDAHYSASSALRPQHLLIALCPEDAREAEYLVLPTGIRAPLADSEAYCREALDRFH